MPNETIPLPEPKRMKFADVCALMPEGVYWGDLLTPQIARELVEAGYAHAAAVSAAKDARIKVLEDALRKACDDMEGWGLYAPEYFRKKHDFVGDVEAARAALGDKT